MSEVCRIILLCEQDSPTPTGWSCATVDCHEAPFLAVTDGNGRRHLEQHTTAGVNFLMRNTKSLHWTMVLMHAKKDVMNTTKSLSRLLHPRHPCSAATVHAMRNGRVLSSSRSTTTSVGIEP
jgi:hypothetical protein